MRPVRATISLSKRTTCLIATHCQVPNVGPTFGPVYGTLTLAHWSYLTPLCDLRPSIFLAKCHVVNVLHRPYMNRMGQDIPPSKVVRIVRIVRKHQKHEGICNSCANKRFFLFANVKNSKKICSHCSQLGFSSCF